VPDAFGPLGKVVRGVLFEGKKHKLGTQVIMNSFPQLLSRMIEAQKHWMGPVFGADRTESWRRAPSTLITVPVFLGKGSSSTAGNEDQLKSTSRTDLHCEPITNVVMQTEGSKRWTLVGPEHSKLLKPRVSPEGRAYFYSSLDPLDRRALHHVPRYEVRR